MDSVGVMGASQLLGLHPFSGGLLGVPGLQELFGQSLQLGRINCGINRPRKALHFKLLDDAEFLRARHDGTSKQQGNIIGGNLLLRSENYS